MTPRAPTTLVPVFQRATVILAEHVDSGKVDIVRALLGLLLSREVPRLGDPNSVPSGELQAALNTVYAKEPPFIPGGGTIFLFTGPRGDNPWRNAWGSQKGMGCFADDASLHNLAFRFAPRDNCPHRAIVGGEEKCQLTGDRSPCKSSGQSAGEVAKLVASRPSGEHRLQYQLVTPEAGDLTKLMNVPARLPLWPVLTAIYSGSQYLENGAHTVTASEFIDRLGINQAAATTLFDDNPATLQNRAIIEMSEPALLSALRYKLYQKGFFVSLPELVNFYLALKPRGFVILTGVSGTGKSRLPRLFAEEISPADVGQSFIYQVPVRPGWNDVADLLGYDNSLTGQFEPGPALAAFDAAAAPAATQPQPRAVMLLLDEMNLARVEHYFADVLSVMETKRQVNGVWKTDAIRVGQQQKRIPDNLFIVGTVNVDESTQGISNKVLDRANTIEFDEVYFDPPQVQPPAGAVDLTLLGSYLGQRKYRDLASAAAPFPDQFPELLERLKTLHEFMKKLRSQFGNRTIVDVCIYMAYAIELIDAAAGAGIELEGFTQADAFDRQLLQKILPRLSGTHDELIRRYGAAGEEGDPFKDLETLLNGWNCPKAAEKVKRMATQDFVNFWEA